jgi:hypothetical protein
VVLSGTATTGGVFVSSHSTILYCNWRSEFVLIGLLSAVHCGWLSSCRSSRGPRSALQLDHPGLPKQSIARREGWGSLSHFVMRDVPSNPSRNPHSCHLTVSALAREEFRAQQFQVGGPGLCYAIQPVSCFWLLKNNCETRRSPWPGLSPIPWSLQKPYHAKQLHPSQVGTLFRDTAFNPIASGQRGKVSRMINHRPLALPEQAHCLQALASPLTVTRLLENNIASCMPLSHRG